MAQKPQLTAFWELATRRAVSGFSLSLQADLTSPRPLACSFWALPSSASAHASCGGKGSVWWVWQVCD